jgi:uridine phosphorylase
MRVVAPLVVLMLAVGACGALSSHPAQTAQGINVTGTLDRGPVPTCPAGEPCDPPAVASMLIFSRPGSTDVSVRVGGDGSFALHLDPGDYIVAAAPPAFQGKIQPSNVRVPDSGTVALRLHIVRSA